jgi:hypothetical protein
MICQADKVVISEFQSSLEKQVFQVLLEHKHSVTFANDRSIYNRVTQEYEQPLTEDSMYIANVSNVSHQG